MKRSVFLILLLIGLPLVACAGGEAEAAEQTVRLIARDIEYDTEVLEVTAGAPVHLTLANEGALDHDFSIEHIPLAGEAVAEHEEEMDEHEMSMEEEDLALHLSAAAGESETITFTPSEPGEYEFFCTVPGHGEAGMAGTLIVSEP